MGRGDQPPVLCGCAPVQDWPPGDYLRETLDSHPKVCKIQFLKHKTHRNSARHPGLLLPRPPSRPHGLHWILILPFSSLPQCLCSYLSLCACPLFPT